MGDSLQETRVETERETEKLPTSQRSPVPCVSCGHPLFEIAVEVQANSRVWIRTRCKSCKVWLVMTYRDGKVTVAQQ